MIKRKLYIKNQIFYDENIFLLEDAEVLVKLIYFTKRIGKVNKSFYYYRIGNNNGCTRNIPFKHLTNILECFENLEKFYQRNNEIEIKNLISRRKNLMLIRMILEGKFCKFQEYDSFFNKYLKIIKKDKFISLKGILEVKKKRNVLFFYFIKLTQNKTTVKILIKRKKLNFCRRK